MWLWGKLFYIIKGVVRALNSLRKSIKYKVTNHGEVFEFEILDVLSQDDFLIKDIHTFEKFKFSVITQYGIGKDYNIEEI